MTSDGRRVRLLRGAYKAAWLIRKGLLLSPWPALNGAQVAVWVGDELLIVRNSYNAYYSLPGGRRNRGESYAACAARELSEETGIEIAAGRLKSAHAEYFRRPFGRDRLEIFEIRLDCKPATVADPVEIAELHWWHQARIDDVATYGPLRRYLQHKPGKP